MKVLIAGAGVGDLTAALSLDDSGFDHVQVLEVASELRPFGAGMSLLPNAVRELAALGLYHQAVEVSALTTEVRYHNQHNDLLLRELRGRSGGCDWPQLSIHRGKLQMLLAQAAQARLDPNCIRTGCRVTDLVELPGSGVLGDITCDGRKTTVQADLLIGADGICSVVRHALHGTTREPVWNGIVVWRGMAWVIPLESADDGRVLRDLAAAGQQGPDELDRIEATPCPRHRPQGPEPPGASRKVRSTVHRVEDSRNIHHRALLHHRGVFEYPVQDCDPLPRWSRGPATLLADAAHGMQPKGSNDTTEAIPSARAVAYSLATSSDPIEALADYERHRRLLTTRIQQANRSMGPGVVIDMMATRGLHGFATVGDGLSGRRQLHDVATRYAELAAFDRDSVNLRSPYDVRGPSVQPPLGSAPATRASRPLTEAYTASAIPAGETA